VSEFVPGNRLTLLRNGEQYFPALIAACDAARTEIFLETYIFAGDGTGHAVASALARAAQRGVAVRLLIDGFGAYDFAPRLRDLLSAAGAELLVFRPPLLRRFLRGRRVPLRRMHRKLACMDGSVAFVGGINIVDDYDGPGQVPPRFDYAVRIEGPLVARVRAEAVQLWQRVARAKLGRRWIGYDAHGARAIAPPPPPPAALPGGQRAALVIRDNVGRRRDIEKAYLELIGNAQLEVLIANAYFFPRRSFRLALVRAARRDVSVALLLQAKVEYALQHYASRALYRSLLEAQIRIHEYYRSFLHAKVAVVDGRMATVGSSNIDPFSLGLAQEANVFVDDPAFAAELRRSLHEAIEQGSRLVPPNYWRRLTIGLRLRIWLSYRLSRLLMSVFGFERPR